MSLHPFQCSLSARSLALVLLLMALALLTACGGSDNSTPVKTGPVTSVSRTFQTLAFSLETPKSVYKVGEAVPLTLTVQNTGTQAVTVTYGDTVNSAFAVQQNGADVYVSNLGGIEAINTISIDPGASKQFTFSWAQTNNVDPNNVMQVASGQYSLIGWLPAGGVNGTSVSVEQSRAELASNPLIITIFPQ